MTLEYIRQKYHVPARRGMRVKFMPACFPNQKSKGGVIKSGRDYLNILVDGERYTRGFHPTYGILYPSE